MQTAAEVTAECMKDTGAWRISGRAVQVALVAISVLPNGTVSAREYRRRIKEEYCRRYECGSVFLIFVLPILISLVSQWIAKWILNHTDITGLKADAIAALTTD